MRINPIIMGTICLLLVTGCGADLVPVDFVAPEQATIGDNLIDAVSISVANNGMKATPEDIIDFWIFFYLSEDRDITWEDTIIGEALFNDVPIQPKETKIVDLTDPNLLPRLEIPYDAPTGSLFIVVYVDGNQYIPEAAENNNIDILPIEILPAP